MPARILFLADTHLGFDLPARPRVERRRRGEDFFAAFELALAPAVRGETDIVVHGGDLFYRSRIPAWLAQRVFARLVRLADAGVDVLWVPGNHERSGVPRGLLLAHPRIHVFERPRTVVLERDGLRLAFVGIPHVRRIRGELAPLLATSGAFAAPAHVRLLCLHQAVEGATVGAQDFVFRRGDDVLPTAEIPAGFAAVLCGHVHRAQALVRDRQGRPLPAPVLYAGSTERTSFAEQHEAKSTLVLTADARPGDTAGVVGWELRTLAVPPMVELDIDAHGDAEALATRLRDALTGLDPHSVVRIRLRGTPSPAALPALRAAALRAFAPPTMHLSLAWRELTPEGSAR